MAKATVQAEELIKGGKAKSPPAWNPPQALVNGGKGITSASVAFRRGAPLLRTPATKHSDGDGE